MTDLNSPALESRLAELEHRMMLAEDRARVANVMGYYEYLTLAHRFRDLANHFALSEPDVTIDIDNMARWVGPEKVRAILLSQDINPEPISTLPLDLAPSAGQMHEHTLTTPIIEVADDGQTAQGLWISPGHETVGGKAYWAWCKYAVDFKKIDGAWKIWHMKIHGTFFTPFDKDWVETAQHAPRETPWADHAGAQAIEPWQYSGEDIPPLLRIPRPYREWRADMSV